jgi:hypothetical protein
MDTFSIPCVYYSFHRFEMMDGRIKYLALHVIKYMA